MALETFKAQLKAQAKTLGVTNLSNKRIDAFAATLEKQNPDLKTDDDHSEKVDAFLELVDIKQIAAYDDWQVTKSKKEGGNKDDKKDPEKKDPEKKDPVDTKVEDDPNMPAWAKALMEQNKNLVETVNKLQSKETKASIQERLKKDLKDIPSSFYDEWSIPEKDDDYEPFTEKVKTKWEAFTKEHQVQPGGGGGSTRTHQPSRGGGKPDDKATKEEIDAVVNNIM